jgi:hypothetical protein
MADILIPIGAYIRHMWVHELDGLQPRDGIIIEHVTVFGTNFNAYKVFFIHEDDYDIFTTAQMEEEFEILSLGETL